MNHKIHYSYFLIFAAVFFLLSISKSTVEKIRGTTIAAFAPAWGSIAPLHADTINENVDVQRYKLENQMLRDEVERLRAIYKREHLLNQNLVKLWEDLSAGEGEADQRHHQILQKLYALEMQALPARVIFRTPESWNSSLWLNVGTADNVVLGREVVAKNSPVVVGTSIVGVIDFVGTHQSRVRLITDSGLTPSVRALRNKTYLAKGEIHGSSQPLWRKGSHILKGIGFNYDFDDEEGLARDLRTGKPIDPASDLPAMPIIKAKDLLVTTGLDGVFPPGLQVAEVTKIKMLGEGDYYYELEAKPTAGNLDELSLVFVIPPYGYDTLDQP